MKIPDGKRERAREALRRAEKGLGKLRATEPIADDFGFLLPYVLDLFGAVTRMIDDESKGGRTAAFTTWWQTMDRSMSDEVRQLRNATLKRQERRAARTVGIELSVDELFSDRVSGVVLGSDGRVHAVRGTPQDYRYVSDNEVAAESTASEWVFKGGPLDEQPVLSTLDSYFRRLAVDVLSEAERLLDP